MKALAIPRFPISAQPNPQVLWFEYRQPIDSDGVGLQPGENLDGMLAHVERLVSDSPNTYVVDGSPMQNLDTRDDMCGLGRTFYDRRSTWAVTPTGTTATAMTLNVQQIVPTKCSPVKQAVMPNQPVTVSVTGGLAPYSWSSPGGSVEAGTGTSYTTSYAQPGTYKITVTSPQLNDHTACSVTVGELPSVDLEINGRQDPIVTRVHSAFLSWTSTNATHCRLTRFGAVPLSGSRVARGLYRTQTFTLTCTNDVGTASGSVMISADIHNPNYDDALCDELIAPDTVQPGQTFTAHLVFRNIGTQSWSGISGPLAVVATYAGSSGVSWGTGSLNLLFSPVAPIAEGAFGFSGGHGAPHDASFTAPTTPGTYQFAWQLQRSGGATFGDVCEKVITVAP